MESTRKSLFRTAIMADRKTPTDGLGQVRHRSPFRRFVLRGSLIIAAGALAGCGTPAARNFGGSWKPVNRFQTQPTEIPLVADYTYYAAPMDETLKTMLTRWAKDSGRELSYQLSFDVTLYTPVSSIHTTDIQSAVQQLTRIYAAQYVQVSATDRKILVQASGVASRDIPRRKGGSPVSTPAQRAGAQ
jgi:hypothetical protein